MLQGARRRGCDSALHLVHALADVSRAPAPRLWVVTVGTQPVGDSLESLSIAHASLWGLAGVIGTETSRAALHACGSRRVGRGRRDSGIAQRGARRRSGRPSGTARQRALGAACRPPVGRGRGREAPTGGGRGAVPSRDRDGGHPGQSDAAQYHTPAARPGAGRDPGARGGAQLPRRPRRDGCHSAGA